MSNVKHRIQRGANVGRTWGANPTDRRYRALGSRDLAAKTADTSGNSVKTDAPHARRHRPAHADVTPNRAPISTSGTPRAHASRIHFTPGAPTFRVRLIATARRRLARFTRSAFAASPGVNPGIAGAVPAGGVGDGITVAAGERETGTDHP